MGSHEFEFLFTTPVFIWCLSPGEVEELLGSANIQSTPLSYITDVSI